MPCRRKPKIPPTPHRTIVLGSTQTEKFRSNHVSTTKYNPLTFFPKNLYQQFSRVANIYFLALAILQFFPSLSTLNPVTSILPLIIVISISMIKELLEDCGRFRSDRVANARPAYRFNGHSFAKTSWAEICVGDTLLIRCDEQLPSDLVVIYTPLPNQDFYIETANLDGETNLKTKQALSLVDSPRDLIDFLQRAEGRLMVDHPNDQLYAFNGILSILGQKEIPVNNKHVALRASTLRNTPYIVGYVCYTGHETKIMKNSTAAPMKKSQLEKLMNKFVVLAFCCLVLFSLFCAIMYAIFTSLHRSEPYFRFESISIAGQSVKRFITHLILFNTLIPISLYVTLEVVKMGQAMFIDRDIKMYDPDSDNPANARTSNLNENLGQIQVIFSDKTGTLTQNVMELFKCSVGDIVYGSGISEIKAGEMRRNGTDPNAEPTKGGFVDARIKEELEKGGKEADDLNQFFTALAICHTCIAETQKAVEEEQNTLLKPKSRIRTLLNLGGSPPAVSESPTLGSSLDSSMNEIDTSFLLSASSTTDNTSSDDHLPLSYSASSPDEGALVNAAAKQGFEFRGMKGDQITIRMSQKCAQFWETNRGQDKDAADLTQNEDMDSPEWLEDGTKLVSFTQLAVLEFNSDRKRNSVLVRCPNKKLVLFSKGADATIFPLLTDSISSHTIDTTLAHLESFGSEGLRTLCVCNREVSESEYEEWAGGWRAALNSMEDRDALVDLAAAKIEHDLNLIGTTAIEDKLQDGVSNTIFTLRKAGIRIWLLTGDKMETALNIGFACRLVDPSMQVIEVDGDKAEEVCNHVAALAHELASIPSCFSSTPTSANSSPFALLLSGQALAICLSPPVVSHFLSLSSRCAVVLCCRVTPKQKADVVSVVRTYTPLVSLAIGDGANDVPMIQRAHVGVGISGKEGMQAVMSSDYSIAQFRFLKRLLLVHGRLSYKRVSMVVLYSFLKNFSFCLTLFWFSWFCGFSGQSLYESWFISLFNLVFTALPIGLVGLADQEVRPDTFDDSPLSYALGMLGREATPRSFVMTILEGIWISFSCFFVSSIILADYIAPDGNAEMLAFFGQCLNLAVVVCVTVRLALHLNFVFWIHYLIFIGSIVAFFVVALFISIGFKNDLIMGEIFRVLGSFPAWLNITMCCIVALVPWYMGNYYNRQFRPTLDTIVREQALLDTNGKKKKEMKRKALKEKKKVAAFEGVQATSEVSNRTDANLLSMTLGPANRRSLLRRVEEGEESDVRQSLLESEEEGTRQDDNMGQIGSYTQVQLSPRGTDSKEGLTERMGTGHRGFAFSYAEKGGEKRARENGLTEENELYLATLARQRF
ncbi:ion-transporting P-type ATPase [Blattamonas nauphoetae]|uniref:Phospholipid-transporting ATPase n=1 Tax=Blattamonas nauphoetae TaxID=2049346 RepID=A0ABQ9XL06_9EUKA|nr:ion-transporting P-type ATPase [Blattamonas nauphoetae]